MNGINSRSCLQVHAASYSFPSDINFIYKKTYIIFLNSVLSLMNCYLVPLNTACVNFFPFLGRNSSSWKTCVSLLNTGLIKVLDEKKEIIIRCLTIKKKASICRRKVQGEV
jgi:hypothetical protein